MSMAVPKVNLIACVDQQMGIGKSGGLPWRLRKDFEIFVRLTSETVDPAKRNVVLMGRKCYESIPAKFRPLKNRINIVLSRTIKEFANEDVVVCSSMQQVHQLLTTAPLCDQWETIWNIGGRDVYELSLLAGSVDRIYLTRIAQSYDCDVLFPTYSKENFAETTDDRLPPGVLTDNNVNFTFHVYNAVQRDSNIPAN